MLDDLRKIHECDAQDALGIAEKQDGQYTYKYNFQWKPTETISNVVVAGMGGSALAAKAFKVVPGLSLPFEIVQDYSLPQFVGKNTLLICSSYSGNTEETVSVLQEALSSERAGVRPMIVVVASGGKLLDIAAENELPHLELPTGYQPRHTFGFQFRALAEILSEAGLIEGFLPTLEAAVVNLPMKIATWLPVVATKDNAAKQIAQELMGKSVVVYSGPKLAPAAYKWKISVNENAKQVAWWNTYPELNHNEFLGWTKQPEHKPYAMIELRSNLEHERVQKRFEVTEKLLSGLRPSPIVIDAQGESLLEQLLNTIAFGDFVSIYLALLNNLNPTPVDLIERFKAELNT
ncbi:MAG TPA: bifunctional phosphoglucose/phosphomannose isomerase [Methylococcales bacterium]